MKTPPATGTVRPLARAEIPSIVKVMGDLASDPVAQAQSRLKAIDVLLRAAATNHPASSDAKSHLSRARPFLDQLIQSPQDSSNSTLRKAMRLSQRIADLIGDCRLVELGLLAKSPSEMKTQEPGSRAKRAAKAADMAGQKIDQIDDKSASDEMRAQRKRRLIKGPSEFREIRDAAKLRSLKPDP